MKITILDTVTILKSLFTDTRHPKVRFKQAQATILAPDGFVISLQNQMKGDLRGGVEVLKASQYDGCSVVTGYQIWGLFNPTRKQTASEWIFAQFEAQHLLVLAQDHLTRFATQFDGAVLPDEMTFTLLTADPLNHSLMINAHGLSCFGGKVGRLTSQLWPSAHNIIRLGPALARIFVYNLRWAQLPPDRLPTLGDFLMVEGLAACFIAEMFPDLTMAPWQIPFQVTDGWEATLQAIAETYYDTPTYNELETNIYGGVSPIGSARPPQPHSLEDEEFAYAQEIIAAVLTITDPYQIAAYLYGDEIVATYGHPTVGLPPYAGFEVAYRLVRDYLERNGMSISKAIVETVMPMPSANFF